LENPGFKKKMTPDEKKQLEAALTKLEEVLKKSEVSGDSETQAIQPSDIKKAMDELSQTANSILNRIENSTPTMQPNDDEDEDNNKNRNDDNNNDNKGDKGDKGDKKDNNDNNDDENKNNEDLTMIIKAIKAIKAIKRIIMIIMTMKIKITKTP